MVPTMLSTPEDNIEALKTGRNLTGGPSNRFQSDSIQASSVNTTEKNCLRIPPASIAGWPRMLTYIPAALSNLPCL